MCRYFTKSWKNSVERWDFYFVPVLKICMKMSLFPNQSINQTVLIMDWTQSFEHILH